MFYFTCFPRCATTETRERRLGWLLLTTHLEPSRILKFSAEEGAGEKENKRKQRTRRELRWVPHVRLFAGAEIGRRIFIDCQSELCARIREWTPRENLSYVSLWKLKSCKIRCHGNNPICRWFASDFWCGLSIVVEDAWLRHAFWSLFQVYYYVDDLRSSMASWLGR